MDLVTLSDGPTLENMDTSKNEVVKFYWLIHVSNDEVNYKKTKGVTALEEKFEQKPFNYLDPARRNVV
ncbi:MAG: suppressor of fused domain protein [Chitinophagaceae bacterium]